MNGAVEVTARCAHLLVESRGPWAGPGADRFLGDAAVLARLGHPVLVLLVGDAVTSAVAVPGSVSLTELSAAGADVVVDRFSLLQRGLGAAGLHPGTRPGGMDDVAASALHPDVKVVWH